LLKQAGFSAYCAKKWAVETMTKLDTAWKKALKQLDFVDDNFQLTTAGRIALL